MGTLTSTTNWQGKEVNGIALGNPVLLESGLLAWDDGSLPDGTLDQNGDITLTAMDNL